MRWLCRWGATLTATLLVACTSIAPVAPDVAPAPAFELSGRVAARYQDRVFTSGLRWKQDAGSDEIWFTAPLGQTIAHLQADAGGVTLTAADRKQYRANSIESLTRSALGWRFPVTGMRYWVLGQTAPTMAATSVERDSAGRFTRFQQGDFSVIFNYAEPAATRPLRIEVAGGDAEIRLVIDDLTSP